MKPNPRANDHSDVGAPSANKSKVIVFGDPMIDRTWLVGSPSSTSQYHGSILPQRVTDLRLRRERPGGAALTAAWLAWDSRFDVHLVAPVSRTLKAMLEEQLVHIHKGLVSESRQDTVKFRVHLDRGGDRVSQLRHRFDLDVAAGPFEIPSSPTDADLVVVADFQKGTVTGERLDKLTNQHRGARWLVDSKSTSIVSERCWTNLKHRPTLIVNRDELAALLKDPLVGKTNWSTPKGTWRAIEEEVLNAAQDLASHFPAWDIVLKLDAQGALSVSLDESGIHQFRFQSPGDSRPSPGVGAGDAFLAGWASALMRGEGHGSCLAHGVARAEAWIEIAERRLERQLVIPQEVPEEVVGIAHARLCDNAAPALQHSGTLRSRLEELRFETTLDGIVRSRALTIARGGGNCGRFLTTNRTLALEVRAFVTEVRHHFTAPGPRRPLNCLVWAAPGSGKSFFVEELAKEVGARLCEVNVSAMSSREEMMESLEAARNIDSPAVVVMIDECATKIAGEHVFSSLLVPLWNLASTKRIAYVLVDSKSDDMVTDLSSFLSYIRGQTKGNDLVSRLNGPRLSMQAPGAVDRAYLVASLMRRMHPESLFGITEAALRALIQVDKPIWSPRDVEYVVERVVPVRPYLSMSDIQRIGSLCSRLSISLAVLGDDENVIGIRENM